MKQAGRRCGWAFALTASLSLCACKTHSPASASAPAAAAKPATVTKNLNLSGYPPEFRKGFTEGCSVARGESKSARPKDESQYAAGWADGFDYCKPRK